MTLEELRQLIREHLEEYNKTEEEKANDRMVKNLQVILSQLEGGEEKLRELIRSTAKIVTNENGKKIGRTCKKLEERLENYQLAGDNYSDLKLVIDDITSIELAEALEGFLIDLFVFNSKVTLHNSDGRDKGRKECDDSDKHRIYIAVE